MSSPNGKTTRTQLVLQNGNGTIKKYRNDDWQNTDSFIKKANSLVGRRVKLTSWKHKTEGDDYWSTEKSLGNKFVQSAMTCNRYQQLNKYPLYDRCGKVRPVLDHVLGTFKDCYTMSREVSV